MKRVIAFGLFGLFGALGLACGAGPDVTVSSGTAAFSDDDLAPANWDVEALADSPSPGSEPINVILTVKGASLTDLLGLSNPRVGLGVIEGDIKHVKNWLPVDPGAGLEFVTALPKGEKRCISNELARITPASQPTAQERGYRIHGCLGVLQDGESHIRAWESKKHRKCAEGVTDAECQAITTDSTAIVESTWYLAVSQEHVCLAKVNGKDKPWHCILPQGFVGGRTGITGKTTDPVKGAAASITVGTAYKSPTGGYNQGRDDLVKDLKALTKLPEKSNHQFEWKVECSDVDRPAGAGLYVPVADQDANDPTVATEIDNGKKILKRVTWDTKASRCVLTAKSRACAATETCGN